MELLITDPWFYAVAVPAVLLMGLAKSGFADGLRLAGHAADGVDDAGAAGGGRSCCRCCW